MSRPISYDLKGASANTGLSPSHLTRALDVGDLKGKRSSVRDDEPTGKWIIKAADLEAYIDGLVDG